MGSLRHGAGAIDIVCLLLNRFISRLPVSSLHVCVYRQRSGDQSIGKHIRTLISGESIASYPVLTLSTIDFLDQDRSVSPSSSNLRVSNDSGGDSWAAAWLYVLDNSMCMQCCRVIDGACASIWRYAHISLTVLLYAPVLCGNGWCLASGTVLRVGIMLTPELRQGGYPRFVYLRPAGKAPARGP